MPETRMEHTQGLGRRAEVWLGGHLLEVCDGISPRGNPYPPGPLENVKFSYMTAEGFTWKDAIRRNPSKRRSLEHQRGWSYVGYGKVESIMPVVIDFGLIHMEDPNWTTDEDLIGKYVRIDMDRLEMVPAPKPDWPEEMR